MNNNLLQIKVKQRLNKLASFDYDHIECWQIQEAFNKAQLEWTRRQLYGINIRKEGAEQSSGLIDDMQRLLTQSPLTVSKKTAFFETSSLPADYLHFVRVDVKAKKDCCPERDMTVYEAEEANMSVLLRDQNRQPDFEWGETLVTLVGNKMRIYTNDDFDVTAASMVYYRLPRDVQFLGCINMTTGANYAADQLCEYNEDVTEILVDAAVAILAGDIESIMQFQREEQSTQKNS